MGTADRCSLLPSSSSIREMTLGVFLPQSANYHPREGQGPKDCNLQALSRWARIAWLPMDLSHEADWLKHPCSLLARSLSSSHYLSCLGSWANSWSYLSLRCRRAPSKSCFTAVEQLDWWREGGLSRSGTYDDFEARTSTLPSGWNPTSCWA